MAILPILTRDNPRLRIKAVRVPKVDDGVRRLAEHRIGALVVEDQWTKLVGIFSERDFINAVARDGASVLGFAVQQLMSSPIISCRPK